MSEKKFTKSEVEAAIKLVVAGTTQRLDPDELSEKLERIPEELKAIIAVELTEGLISLMRSRINSVKRHNNAISELLSQSEETHEECTCHRHSYRKEEPEICILKNGRKITGAEKKEFLDILKDLFGEN